MTVSETFARAFLRRRVQRWIVDGGKVRGKGIAGLRQIFSQFQPESLRRFIEDDRSVIDFYRRGITDQQMREYMAELAPHKDEAMMLITSIRWEEVLDLLAKNGAGGAPALPRQVAIVREHPGWYDKEKCRAQNMLMQMMGSQ